MLSLHKNKTTQKNIITRIKTKENNRKEKKKGLNKRSRIQEILFLKQKGKEINLKTN